jgi:hypothetical protein
MVIATPLALADSANTIGRALDPDVGGDRSFAGVLCAESPPPATHVVCDVLLTGDFAQQCQYMLAHAEMLHAACCADYAARWPGLEAPSLADCAEFLVGSIITIEFRGRSLDDVLQGIGMVRLLSITADGI